MDLIDITSTAVSASDTGSPVAVFNAEMNVTAMVADDKKSFAATIFPQTGEFNLLSLTPKGNVTVNTPYNSFNEMKHEGDFVIASNQQAQPVLSLMDIRESYHPSAQKSLKLPYGYPNNTALGTYPTLIEYVNPYLYVISDKSLLIYYSDQLTAVGSLVGNFTFNHTITDMYFDRVNSIIFAASAGPLYAVDVSNPRACDFLRLTTSYAMSTSTKSPPRIEKIGSYLFVSTANATNSTISSYEFRLSNHRFYLQKTLNNELNPFTKTIYDIAINPNQNLLYLAAEKGIFQLDISNRSSPQGLVQINSPQVNNRRIVFDSETGFLAAACPSPSSIYYQNVLESAQKATFNLSVPAADLKIKGSYIYLAQGANGFAIVNRTNPTSPSMVNYYTTPFSDAKTVVIEGNVAILCDTTADLVGVNFTNKVSCTTLFTKQVAFNSASIS